MVRAKGAEKKLWPEFSCAERGEEKFDLATAAAGPDSPKQWKGRRGRGVQGQGGGGGDTGLQRYFRRQGPGPPPYKIFFQAFCFHPHPLFSKRGGGAPPMVASLSNTSLSLARKPLSLYAQIKICVLCHFSCKCSSSLGLEKRASSIRGCQ